MREALLEAMEKVRRAEKRTKTQWGKPVSFVISTESSQNWVNDLIYSLNSKMLEKNFESFKER